MIENSIAFTAYNQAVEDAKAAIRDESQGGGYWAATFINAIARKCSPHVYVNRLAAPASTIAPQQSGHAFIPPAGAMCARCGLSILAHQTAPAPPAALRDEAENGDQR